MTIPLVQRSNMRPVKDRLEFFIGGAWVTPHGGDRCAVVEAATAEPFALAALGDEVDMDRAVRAARAALDGPWGRTTPAERADAMRRMARAFAARCEEASVLVSRENGMPITLSRGYNGVAPSAILDMYAGLIEACALERPRASARGATIVRREPVGVVGAIVPWNYPLALGMAKVAPALAAGCTVVLKPSPDTALDCYLLADAAAEAGLPDGVLNVVLADREASFALVKHPLVDKIAFTGSTAAGRAIGAECGRQVKRCSLELGGKSASIFLEDGSVQRFVDGLPSSTFQNNSQTCTTQSRVLVHRSRYGEVVDALAAYARGMRVGNPLEEDVQCGPMASRQHLERVMGFIEGARTTSRLVAGGNRLPELGAGWFVQPTIFADVDNKSPLAQDEVFGPVIAVMPFDTADEAVRLANDSPYGLAGSVWTEDEDRGLEIARAIRTGTIGVNYYDADLGAPFGGMKQSGIGREFGPEALENYFEIKSIYASARQM